MASSTSSSSSQVL
uniref:Uncharacterized protein n=1 Tax=Arundo donax TaxID=35708 RepID=A0A0A9EI80_ARUDO